MPTLRVRSTRNKDIELRDSLWPDAAERLWDRQKFSGYTTIPKTMPLVMRALDELSAKGQPLGEAYLALWCSTWDNGFVRLGRAPDLAYAAGFTGQRGLRTFQERLRRLEDLGFVEIRPSGGQAFGLAFIPNPHVVLLRLWALKQAGGADAKVRLRLEGLQEGTFNAILERASDVGCNDVASELARQAAPAAPAAAAAPAKASRPLRKPAAKRSAGAEARS